MPSGVHDGKRGGSETGYKKGRYDSIKGFTYKQVEDLMEDEFWNYWVLRKSANRKRFRYVIALYVHYHMPDTLQTIVDNWNCSEHVISVGNIKNRMGHTNFNGEEYIGPTPIHVGELALTSSKGPNRMSPI